MKKHIRAISLILILCFAAALISCEKTDHKKIAEEYAKLNKAVESGIDFTCYGEFNGAHVVMLNGVYPDALSEETVDGVTFYHSQIKSFDVYKNGKFYTLREAFDNGLLTHDNLVTLSESYNPERAGKYYTLNVIDLDNYIIERLNGTYKAGTSVTVKTEVLLDVDMIAYLNGESLGRQTAVLENDEYHWEFYFTMPECDSTLTFELSGGMF
ncbi:MAG: hypothetical protein J1F39_05870 [Clostridiales bacterium]|nr:hypothetical protein [Clostridiales bacterium]